MAALVAASPALAQQQGRCTVTVLNRTIEIEQDGTFTIENVPAIAGRHRVRKTCLSADGSTLRFQTGYITLVPDGVSDFGEFEEGIDPIPESLAVSLPSPPLEDFGATAQVTVTCTYATDHSADCTSGEDGTSYRAANPAVCTVADDGLVSASGDGPCVVTAVNEGVVAAAGVLVRIGGDVDGDGMPGRYESLRPCLAAGVADGGADPDADGVTSSAEHARGTEPCIADTDGDGSSDGDEATRGTDPLDADTDGDLLLDGDEAARGTDPRSAYSDSGCLPDGAEVDMGLNPLDGNDDHYSIDRDGDGLRLCDEFDRGTRDDDEDFDDDGLTDGEEVLGHRTDPTVPDATAPAVALSSPASGSSVLQGAPVHLVASATDDGRVVRVQFLVNGTLTVTDGGAPFDRIWRPATLGATEIAARAFDTNGNATTSAPVTITVLSDPLTTLTGRVVDAVRAPVAGALVTSLTGQSGVSLPDGTFSIGDVPSGADVGVRAVGVVAAATLRGRSVRCLPESGGTSELGDVVLRDEAYPGQILTADQLPRDIVLADLDRDGVTDLVTVENRDVAYFRGLGDVRFADRLEILTGNQQPPIADHYGGAAGDFDEDGIPDLVVAGDGDAYAGPAGMSILRGVGDGTVEPPVRSSLPRRPMRLAVADFDLDGHEDVVGGWDAGIILVRGRGDLTFETPVSIAFSPSASFNALQVADANGDGRPDVVIGGRGSVVAFLGSAGGLEAPLSSAGASPNSQTVYSLDLADLDADGDLDVVTGGGANELRALFGQGDGRFVPGPFVSTALASVFGVQLADIDGDGRVDLVASGSTSTTNVDMVGIHRGNGDGTFGAAMDFGTGSTARQLVVRDLDGDGSRDVVSVSTFDWPELTVIRGAGCGRFDALALHPTGSFAYDPVLGDFDEDGQLDLFVTGYSRRGTSLLLGIGDGTLQARDELGNMFLAAAGDVNRDGHLDVVGTTFSGDFAQYPGARLRTLLGNGDGTFDEVPPMQFTTGINVEGLTLGDVTRDGRGDVVVGNSSSCGGAAVLVGRGDGTFDPLTCMAAGHSERDVAVGDVTGDGIADLLSAGGVLLLRRGLADGTLAPPVVLGGGWDPLALGDADGDGDLDVVLRRDEGAFTARISVYVNAGDGTFSAIDVAACPPRSLQLADATLDGLPDIVARCVDPSFAVKVFPGLGGGTFGPPLRVPLATADQVVVGVDLDRDGAPDLVQLGDAGNAGSMLTISLHR